MTLARGTTGTCTFVTAIFPTVLSKLQWLNTLQLHCVHSRANNVFPRYGQCTTGTPLAASLAMGVIGIITFNPAFFMCSQSTYPQRADPGLLNPAPRPPACA